MSGKVTLEQINSFFESLGADKPSPPPKKEEPKNKTEFNKDCTNVMYITTRCSLSCEYCYERHEREKLVVQKDISKEEILSNLEKVNANNTTGSPAVVVIFGGEPLLRPDLVEFTVREGKRINPNGFAFCLTTNGLFFLKEENVLWMKELKKDHMVSIEVSWDGTGHSRRKFPDQKESRDLVEKALKLLQKHDIPISIRYTVHDGNYQSVVQDLVYCLEIWKNVGKIQLSYYYDELGKSLGVDHWTEVPKKLGYQDLYKGIFFKYSVPICQEICETCMRCRRTSGVNYFIPNKDSLSLKHDENGNLQSTFDHWV